MRASKLRAPLVLGLLAVEFVAAQSLPPCADVCVSKTRTKCKSTDYVCACSDGKYLPSLLECIGNICNDESQSQAHGFLASLCLGTNSSQDRIIAQVLSLSFAAVGHPIENQKAPAGAVIELRDLVPTEQATIAIRQIEETGFPQTGFDTTSTQRAFGTASAASTTQSGSSSNSNNNSDNGGGGLSTGAKIGIGVGVPLGVGLIAGLVALGFFMGRRSKKQQAQTSQPGAPPMPGPTKPPPMAGPMGPAELDQSAQYIGHEMPTQQNTAEISVGSPPPGFVQPVYAWPQPGQSQPGQQQYPQYAQPMQGQYFPPMQQQFPPPGQQWPQQPQQSAAELPERMRSPQA